MTSLLFANAAVKLFHEGGPIMYPIVLVALVAVAVVGERAFWWLREGIRRDPDTLEKVLGAMENSDFRSAIQLSKGSEDPIVRMIYRGLSHVHGSLTGALQIAAGAEIKRAGRFLMLIDTCITVAPLLGLLGTVTGIMASFRAVGGNELAVEVVSGGIGEALIATAAGLMIAIFCLLPFNYFNERLTKLQFELETAATNVEVMVAKAKMEGFDTMVFRRENSAVIEE
ncbi:MAG TPA: MotA/TolQ/ExbB proton channel family protein [Verrucomicrobiota bacterium]|nr:MotA/TolQ/ExbB proton channel family protein [Verrucomicrobiales bacterium]HRI12646.1 MotA/TolQ/ExbB proton channel family protein [Verrucomicrobiota bacterium]